MLYVDDDNVIELTRGDTARFDVTIVNSIPGSPDIPYIVQPDDVLEFSLKKTANDEEYLIHKKISGSVTFHILPEDTKSLEYGKYVYDVQLTTKGDVYTVITPTKFKVLKEVT